MKIFHKYIMRLLCVFLAVILMAACDDEAGFSSNPSYRLAFSNDTVQFDTVFTTIGSSTRMLQVYNRNDVSLRIVSVTQASGGESGFRVNVDGQFATDFTDLEIRDNDSLYVFVEITPKEQGSDAPLLIEDSLVFVLESGTRQCVRLEANGQDALFLHAPHYTHDDTLSDRRPYVIYDSLSVDSGVTLTIEAGVRLFFHKDAECLVRGTLQAVGTLDAPIVFRGDRTDNMFSYLPYDRIAGQWGGIRLFSSSFYNNFIHCDIHSAKYGIKCDMSDPAIFKLNFENSIIHNVEGNGLELTMCQANIGNSLLTNAGGNCVDLLGGMADFVHCTIYSSSNSMALSISNIKNDTIYPLYGVNFLNCLITGLADDVITGVVADKTDSTDYSQYAQYAFDYSLINSEDKENEHFINITWDSDTCATYKKTHFKLIDYRNELYDFHLDSLSTARGAGIAQYSQYYPTDMDGIDRSSVERPDAGCYQWRGQ